MKNHRFPPFAIRGLNHVTLAVADLARSIDFYRDVLGMEVVHRWPEGAYLRAGSLWFCLRLDSAAAIAKRCDETHLAFDVAEEAFAGLRDAAIDAGVEIWRRNRSEGESLYFLDPDRHKLEIHAGSLQSRMDSIGGSAARRRENDRERALPSIRSVRSDDRTAWARMRQALWPEAGGVHEAEIDRFYAGKNAEPSAVLIAEVERDAVGFAELSIRAYAEGCVTDRVGYLEGLYVEPEFRKLGIARALVQRAESWAVENGCREFASDAELQNQASAAMHRKLGFEESGRLVCFRKTLTNTPEG